MQLAEVMSFKGLGKILEELEQIRRRLVGQLERDTDDGGGAGGLVYDPLVAGARSAITYGPDEILS